MFSHHHMICLNKWHLHLQDFNFSSFQKKNANCSISFKLRSFVEIFVTLESTPQRASVDRTAVCPLLLLWLQMCISHTGGAQNRTHTLRILCSHHSPKDTGVMNNTCFDRVCNPRGSRITHHAHRVECQCKQFWICPQSLTCSCILPPPLDPVGYQQGCPI